MKHNRDVNLGIMFRREYPPESLLDFAQRTEAVGFDELWVVEDCFYASGPSSAAAALASTESLKVGLGIMPVVVRNPVFTAMEIATLARMFPGRFLPGLGHGVAGWMKQIGAFPRSQLAALVEVTTAVKRLLAGGVLEIDGKFLQIRNAHLVHPPDQVPPISLGVIGPKSLAISGAEAGGTILSEYASPAYTAWAIDQIQAEYQKRKVQDGHRLTLFAFASPGSTTVEAYTALRPMVAEAIASGGIDAKLAPMGILDEARARRENEGQDRLVAEMPDVWIQQLTIAGTSEDWRSTIDAYIDLGVHSVILVPMPDTSPDVVDVFARHLGL